MKLTDVCICRLCYKASRRRVRGPHKWEECLIRCKHTLWQTNVHFGSRWASKVQAGLKPCGQKVENDAPGQRLVRSRSVPGSSIFKIIVLHVLHPILLSVCWFSSSSPGGRYAAEIAVGACHVFPMHAMFCCALFDGYVSLSLFCALLSVCTLSSHVSRESVLASALPV